MERTFSIIKPDAVSRNLIGQITQRFEDNGLRVIASKMKRLTTEEAENFYAEHKGREFYEPLVAYMTSAPIIVQVLEGEDAIAKNRQIMGATDPAKAEAGTIRSDFALSVRENSAHGSDSPESAAREIAFFFNEDELCARS
ncbi:nucleoside-diphosphate kinase [Thiomicrorhabdus lithotrophica]|uniref:Nucleoside diphosphate kinase n=1 Tax=Thiomicrorhabdus lithotrophica TaxID=2949997 RepID=A0ABY8CBD6_9GAMM|nr:nucleoside-diphosphate kinase [Thiomicrorhabdus lithotrophica]WEJ61995.1 nucleoside-diphosphate kinase [Thiomicrorhabdus lithotrophica]